MKNDLRWRLGTSGHPKVVRLVQACGERAFRALAGLWEWTASNRPKGDLKGMDALDIAVAAGWPDAPACFIETLVSVGLLDGKPKRWSVHDWEDAQPYIFHSDVRSAAAKALARKRWDATRNAARMPDAMRDAMRSDDVRNAPIPTPDPAPKPEPTPTPTTAEVLASPPDGQKRNGSHPKPAAPWANGGPVPPDSRGEWFVQIDAERRAKRAAILAKQAAGEVLGPFNARFLAETAYLNKPDGGARLAPG